LPSTCLEYKCRAFYFSPGSRVDLLQAIATSPETADAIREAMLTLAQNDSNVFNSRRAVANAGQW